MLCSFQAEGKNDTTEGVDVRGRYGNFCQANKGGHACVGRPPHFFGEASGLKTKFQKSTIIPIRCEGLNLNNILAGSPTEVLCFPIISRIVVNGQMPKASGLPAIGGQSHQQAHPMEWVSNQPSRPLDLG
jgi:hypothetical protein